MPYAYLLILYTAGEDYITVNDSLLFTPGGNSAHCFDVVVLDDSISESVETFTLSLVAMDDEETTHVDTVTVTILDGECKGTIIKIIREVRGF